MVSTSGPCWDSHAGTPCWVFPGDVAFLGMMDSTTTVASLKEKLQETTAIQVGWQVLLLGGKGGFCNGWK